MQWSLYGKYLFLAMLGTLLRITIKFIFPATYWLQLLANLLIQMLGSFIYGLVAKREDEKEIGLCLCGSITSFSGWILIISQSTPFQFSFILLPTFSLFVWSYAIGLRYSTYFTFKIQIDSILACLSLSSYIICIILACLNFVVIPLALVFSPFGVACRYLLQKLNGDAVYTKYLGTTLVNITGSIAILLISKYCSNLYWQAFMDGFLGCYTTISTISKDTYTTSDSKIWVVVSIVLSWLVGLLLNI